MTMANPSDRDLGMDRPITRRDFLNGVGLTLTGSLAYPWFEALGQPAAFAPEKAPGYYPPARMGLRGSHDGSWEVARALRDGKTWHTATVDPDEVYDLVVEDKTGEGERDEKTRRRAFATRAPFTEKARHDFLRLHEEPVDYLPGLSADEKRARLKRISYADFLRDYARVDPQVIAYFQQRPHGETGVGIDAISALESLGFPGFQGMGLTGRRGQPGQQGAGEPYIFHFPDGNASIARLLVRSLIPGVASGNTMEDVVTARFDYARLDEADSPIRIRLNSTAVKVRHLGTPEDSRKVAVIYVRGEAARQVRARRCVLACYHSIIPRLCPELPERQRVALADGVKVPLVYANILIRDWTSFQRLRPPDLWDSVVEPSSGFRLRRRSSTRVAAWCRDR